MQPGDVDPRIQMKMARKFDLEEIFEQAKYGAIERCRKNIPPRQEIESDNEPSPEEAQNELYDTHRESEDENHDNEDDEIDFLPIPCSNVAQIWHGTKKVSAISIDSSGARMASGAYDSDVRLWDFAGMDSYLKSFRTVELFEKQNVGQVRYSHGGELLLVSGGAHIVQILDREGEISYTTAKGFQYISDVRQTKGHISVINDCCWNPFDRNEFISSANDGSLRIWKIDTVEERHHKCIKICPRNRVSATCITYSSDSRLLLDGTDTGILQAWDKSSTMITPKLSIERAHMSAVTSLCPSIDGYSIASRGHDDSVKLFDIRKFREPIFVVNDLDNCCPATDVLFCPKDSLIVTVTQNPPQIVFIDKATGEIVKRVDMENAATRVLWNERLNQIATARFDGSIRIHYDPRSSSKGVVTSINKKMKKAKMAEYVKRDRVLTPHALPIFEDKKERNLIIREEKIRKNAITSCRPDLPIDGTGVDGRLGTPGATLVHNLLRKIAVQVKEPDNYDIRAAILNQAEEAEKNPMYIAPAYKRQRKQ